MTAQDWQRPQRSLTNTIARRLLRSWRVALPALVALCLLTACAGEPRLVMRAVMMPPVSQELTAALLPPKCTPRPAEEYPPAVLGGQIDCLSAAEIAARNRHAALASAIRVRESKMAELANSTK